MNNKRTAFIAVIVSLVVTLGWQFKPLSAYASRISIGALVQDSVPPSDPPTATWEYRILSFPSYQATKKPLGDAQSFFSTQPFLEDEINKLTAQGYVVDRFEIDTPSGSGADVGYAPRFAQFVVLLKRVKK